MKRISAAVILLAALTTGAMAVSVGELVAKCGDDAKAHCEGVGYGDAMTECLAKQRAKLTAKCKVIVDRVKAGEKVSLF
jgi:hypothetical protein